jgi:hypothetical protein
MGFRRPNRLSMHIRVFTQCDLGYGQRESLPQQTSHAIFLLLRDMVHQDIVPHIFQAYRRTCHATLEKILDLRVMVYDCGVLCLLDCQPVWMLGKARCTRVRDGIIC